MLEKIEKIIHFVSAEDDGRESHIFRQKSKSQRIVFGLVHYRNLIETLDRIDSIALQAFGLIGIVGHDFSQTEEGAVMCVGGSESHIAQRWSAETEENSFGNWFDRKSAVVIIFCRKPRSDLRK